MTVVTAWLAKQKSLSGSTSGNRFEASPDEQSRGDGRPESWAVVWLSGTNPQKYQTRQARNLCHEIVRTRQTNQIPALTAFNRVGGKSSDCLARRPSPQTDIADAREDTQGAAEASHPVWRWCFRGVPGKLLRDREAI